MEWKNCVFIEKCCLKSQKAQKLFMNFKPFNHFNSTYFPPLIFLSIFFLYGYMGGGSYRFLFIVFLFPYYTTNLIYWNLMCSFPFLIVCYYSMLFNKPYLPEAFIFEKKSSVSVANMFLISRTESIYIWY